MFSKLIQYLLLLALTMFMTIDSSGGVAAYPTQAPTVCPKSCDTDSEQNPQLNGTTTSFALNRYTSIPIAACAASVSQSVSNTYLPSVISSKCTGQATMSAPGSSRATLGAPSEPMQTLASAAGRRSIGIQAVVLLFVSSILTGIAIF